MTTIALEISVNDERLYTVGVKEWRMLMAQIMGHRTPLDSFPKDNWPPDQDFPDKDFEDFQLFASVAINHDPPAKGGSLKSQSYKSVKLGVGDIVTIKIVEADAPDKPNAPKPDTQPPGQVELRIASNDDRE